MHVGQIGYFWGSRPGTQTLPHSAITGVALIIAPDDRVVQRDELAVLGRVALEHDVREALVVPLVDLGRGRHDCLRSRCCDVTIQSLMRSLISRSMKRRRRAKPATKPLGRVASHFTSRRSAEELVPHPGRGESAAQLAWTLSGADLDTYRCDYCFQWHMGKRFRED